MTFATYTLKLMVLLHCFVAPVVPEWRLTCLQETRQPCGSMESFPCPDAALPQTSSIFLISCMHVAFSLRTVWFESNLSQMLFYFYLLRQRKSGSIGLSQSASLQIFQAPALNDDNKELTQRSRNAFVQLLEPEARFVLWFLLKQCDR
jgi:hypothetical protein